MQENKLYATVVKTGRTISKVTIAVNTVVVIAMCLFVCASIVLRLVGHPSELTNVICEAFVVCIAFLSVCVGFDRRTHLRMSLIDQKLSKKGKIIYDIAIHIVALLFYIVLTRCIWTVAYKSLTTGEVMSATLAFPMWIPKSFMFIGCVLADIQIVFNILTLCFDLQNIQGEKEAAS